MPKVSDAHRLARREQIADAALRVLERNGIAGTSMPSIAEECGLSIGAIYANFENKAELARYIAGKLIAWRVETLDRLAADGEIHPPAEVMGLLLAAMTDDRSLPVVLQFWSKATVEPDLRALLTEQLGALRAGVARALGAWAASRGAEPQLADRSAAAVLIMCQGYLANRCLYGWLTTDEYLDAAVAALGADLSQPANIP